MRQDDEANALRKKLEQARVVIDYLISEATTIGAEGERAARYFADDRHDPDFLPWPRQETEGIRPEDLNSANDG